MKSFIKIALVAFGIATMTFCETKKPAEQATEKLYADTLEEGDSLMRTIPRDTNESDVQDTMLEARPTEGDMGKK